MEYQFKGTLGYKRYDNFEQAKAAAGSKDVEIVLSIQNYSSIIQQQKETERRYNNQINDLKRKHENALRQKEHEMKIIKEKAEQKVKNWQETLDRISEKNDIKPNGEPIRITYNLHQQRKYFTHELPLPYNTSLKHATEIAEQERERLGYARLNEVVRMGEKWTASFVSN